MFTAWLRSKLKPKSRSWPPERPLLVYGGQGARSRIGLSPTRGLKKGGDLRAPRQENKMAAPRTEKLD